MQSSGESEFSGSAKQPKTLTLNFWQSFLLTLAGVAGMISLVANGPIWLTVTGFVLVIVLLFSLIITQYRGRK